MFRERIPSDEYRKLADSFTGEAFDADAIARLAVDAGMKYAVLTTRHHEGFCRRYGLRVGLYISNKDWTEPGYWEPEKYPESRERMISNRHAMVAELLTGYETIDVLWVDGSWVDVGRKQVDMPSFWRSQELLDQIYELQPAILVNNRLALDADLDAPEQHVTASAAGRGREACTTIGDESGYDRSRRCCAPEADGRMAAGRGVTIVPVALHGDDSLGAITSGGGFPSR